MRGSLKSVLIAAVVAVASTTVLAHGYTGRGEELGWHVSQPSQFMVSGVLQKPGTLEIKPVHGIFVAKTGEIAVAAFTEQVRTTYPGFALISTLASPVPLEGTCELHI